VSAANFGTGLRTDDEPLVSTVARLRAERDGLRRAMQSRALIEQAKGVLMAGLRLTADEAFARMLEVSQRSNVKLAQVAATVVATVSPPPEPPTPLRPGPAVQDGHGVGGPDGATPAEPTVTGARANPPRTEPPRTEPPATSRHPDLDGVGPGGAGSRASMAHVRHLLTIARLHAAESYGEIVAALADTTPAPSSVVLLLTEADGALRLVAARGLSPEVASQWVRIPPQVEVPLTDAVRRGEPVWLPEQAAAAYPILEAIDGASRSLVALPLTDGVRVFGVLGMSWDEPGMGGEHERAYLTALGEACGRAALPLASSPGLPGTEDAWLRPLLDATLGSAAVLNPVRSGERVTDFVFEALNDRAAAEAERYGAHTDRDVLLSELPGPGAEVLLPLYRDVLADGRPRQLDELVVPAVRPSWPTTSLMLRAVRLGDRVVASWRARSPGELLFEDLVATERIAGVASLRWRPANGLWLCSPTLPTLLDWPRGAAPPTPLTIGRAVANPHWPAVRRAVVAALRGGGPVTVSAMTRRGRWLRVTLARIEDGALRATVQDVTERRAALARQRGQEISRRPRR
jgi:hypothetical protein